MQRKVKVSIFVSIALIATLFTYLFLRAQEQKEIMALAKPYLDKPHMSEIEPHIDIFLRKARLELSWESSLIFGKNENEWRLSEQIKHSPDS
jgi:hypothetical protein